MLVLLEFCVWFWLTLYVCVCVCVCVTVCVLASDFNVSRRADSCQESCYLLLTVNEVSDSKVLGSNPIHVCCGSARLSERLHVYSDSILFFFPSGFVSCDGSQWLDFKIAQF